MSPAVLLSFVQWTLTAEDSRVTLTAREVCIAEDCSKTGSPRVDEQGVWHFDSGVQVRWKSNVAAELSLDGKRWTQAGLTFPSPSVAPPKGLDILAPNHPGPAPGRWDKATAACDRARPVWHFDPILRDQPTLTAYPNGTGWSLRTGDSVAMCHDAEGQFGGVL